LLEGLFGRCQLSIYTDSQYLRQGITEWMEIWVNRGWQTSNKEPVKNQDLWRVLHRLTQAHDVTWRWLKGHTGHPFNERADRLATEALRSLQRTQRVSLTRPPSGERQPVADGRPVVDICVKASCRGAERRGGWAAVMRTGEHAKSLSGSEPSTTANAMLIRGATEALKALTKPCQVTLYSDANYLIKGASLWVKGWQARGWQTREGKPVENRAAWEALLEAARPHHITWLQVQGETAPADLSWAGELATEAANPEEPES
jgi:ribonuclease HI